MKNKNFPAQNEILCPRDSEGGRENSPFMRNNEKEVEKLEGTV